jgi:hypothetical protein
MEKLLKGLVVFFSILTGGAFLSGAGVISQTWYALPHELSRFVVAIGFLWFLVSRLLWILSYFTKKNH